MAFFPALGLAASIDSLHRQGVKAYGKGNYEQALDLFSQAVAKKPEDAKALYNQGTAFYKLKSFSEASQAFTASAAADKNPKTRARTEYNKGRTLLTQAGKNQKLAPKREQLLAANQAFQQALRNDPGLKAARKGIEDFRKEFAKLNQQPPAGQQGQGQQQQNQSGPKNDQQDLQEQLNEAGQQQQDMADQSKENSSGGNQNGPSNEQMQDMAAQQQNVRQALEKIKEDLNKEGQDQDNLSKQLEEAIDAQKKAEESLNQGDLNQAQEHQQQAADSLSKMAANLDTEKEAGAEQSPAPAVNSDTPKGHEENAPASGQQADDEQDQQADKTAATLADILDGEKALHEMRRLRMRQQRPTSGKDW
ncbi:MAG: tetratricopeptide repeat protein [Thermodesulfobacteriota bacterium]